VVARTGALAVPMRMVTWTVIVLTLAVGFHSSGVVDARPGLAVLTVVVGLHAVPLLALAIPITFVRVSGLWFGVFLVAQYVLSPYLLGDSRHFRTLMPDAKRVIDVLEGAIPGVVGVQRITTDGQGFRVLPPVDYAKKRGFRIFVMGGSTTEQSLLDDQVTWTYLLQQQLAARSGEPVEVINTGRSGTRAVHHLATLTHVVDDATDCAVFLLGVNDWMKQIREHYGSSRYRREEALDMLFTDTLLGRGLKAVIPLVSSWLPRGAVPDLDGTVQPYDDAHRRARNNSLARSDQRSLTFEQVAHSAPIESISDFCRKKHVPCLFLTQPHGYSPKASPAYRRTFWMTPASAKYTLDLKSLRGIARLYNSYLMEFAHTHGHQAIDLAAHVRPSAENFYDEVHFNVGGAQRVADVLTDGFMAGACGFESAEMP
jgi:hypothetical protein